MDRFLPSTTGSGCGKMEINYNNLVKGLSMRKKLQNSKGYAESPEFQLALGLFQEVHHYKLDP